MIIKTHIIYLFFLKFSFEQFYEGIISNPSISKNIPFRIVTSSNYWIQQSFFNSLSFINGGAISSTTANSKFLIEFSTFYRCTSTNSHGGAIFINSTSSEIVLNMICALDCYTVSTTSTANAGQFMFNIVSSSGMNFLNYVSISFCTTFLGSRRAPIYLINGKQKVHGNNFSYNFCQLYSGFVSQTSSEMNSTFCTFSNNYATSTTCILINGGTKNNVLNCNLYNNTHAGTNSGTIHNVSPAQTNISETIFIFSALQHYFSNTGILRITNCWMDYYSHSGTSPILENKMDTTQTYILNHYQSDYCQAENIYLSQTPIPISEGSNFSNSNY